LKFAETSPSSSTARKATAARRTLDEIAISFSPLRVKLISMCETNWYGIQRARLAYIR
jgi:hypothetical protein